MKRLILFTLSLILLIPTSSDNAFASLLNCLEPSLGPYMTDEGSTTPKPNQTFGLNEKPYAFIQFKVSDLNTEKPLYMKWRWRYDNKRPISWSFETIINFPETSHLDLFNSLDNWDFQKKSGEWSVRTSWRNWKHGRKAGWCSSEIDFTVTPEPASYILFLMGGGILGGIRMLQKRSRLRKN